MRHTKVSAGEALGNQPMGRGATLISWQLQFPALGSTSFEPTCAFCECPLPSRVPVSKKAFHNAPEVAFPEKRPLVEASFSETAKPDLRCYLLQGPARLTPMRLRSGFRYLQNRR